MLRSIPLPVRLGLGLLSVIMLYKLLQNFGGFSGLIWLVAIVLWICVLLAALYDHGLLNPLTKVPGISHLLAFLTRRKSGAAVSEGDVEDSAAKSTSGRALTEEERDALFAEGMGKLDTLVGVDESLEIIEQRLLDVARAAKGATEKGFGTKAPALVVVLCGPHGVGKTETAFAISKIYAGMSALESAKVVTVREQDVRSGAHSDVAQEKTEAAIGGTLLLDDADWLLAADPYGGAGSPGVDFGVSMLDVLRTRPQETLVIITLSDSAERRLQNDGGHARWLGKLTVRSVPFSHLEIEDLYRIFQRHLDGHDVDHTDDTQVVFKGFVRDERARLSDDHFDNAEAARRMAERALEASFARRPDLPDGQRRVIDADDLRIAMDEL
ncbi:MAG: hypothetical protein AAGA36_01740 [Pseudomonadota bacterium]